MKFRTKSIGLTTDEIWFVKIDMLITQYHQFALILRNAIAPIREPSLAVLAHKGCVLGIGLEAAGPDNDCAHLAFIGLSYLDLQEEHGWFPAEFVGNILDYGKLYLDDGWIL